MTAQPERSEDAEASKPAMIDPEAYAGRALWDAVGDPSWAPSDEFLGYMARASFDVQDLASLLRQLLCVEGHTAASRWTQGIECLVTEAFDRLDSLMQAVDDMEDVQRLVQFCAARHGQLDVEALPADLMQHAATWFVAYRAQVPPDQPEAWWTGYDEVWPAQVWWPVVAELASDIHLPLQASPRLRPALRFATPAQQIVIVVRLFESSPKWSMEQLAEVTPEVWDPLMDLAEVVVGAPDGGDASSGVGRLAPGVAAILGVLSKRFDRALAPQFFSTLLGRALNANRHVDAVHSLNQALQLLPVGPRQRLMLSSSYLRWRHIPACPTQVVIDWAVGEVSKMSPRTFSVLQKNFPDGAFHFGSSLDELRAIAADALGGAGEAALPFLVDGISRATDANKVVFASALASIRTPEAMGPLLQALANGSATVRRVIGDGLALFGDDLVPELEPLLEDPRRPVRAATAAVLARMEPSGDVRDLAARALRREDASEVRAVLKNVVDAPVRPQELVGLERQEAAIAPPVRRAIADSLSRSQGQAWRDHAGLGVVLVGLVAEWFAQQRAAQVENAASAWYDVLLHFAEDAGLPWMACRVADHPKFQHQWLAEVAEVVGRRVSGPLHARLTNASGERRRMLLRALAAYCPRASVSQFMRNIASGDADLRRICHHGLIEAGEAALGPLHAALSSDDARTQQQAARVLERLPDPRNVPALRACLDNSHDHRAAWVIQRAMVVSLEEASSDDDRSLDRMLRRQSTGATAPFIVDMALPKVRYRSGHAMSSESRAWFVSAMYMVGQKVDWFLPLSYTARLLWAIKQRLDPRSAYTFLDELTKQVRSARQAEADAFLTVATALLAAEADIEALIGRIGAADWPDVTAERKRFVFLDGDPRLLFLRGTPTCVRAAFAWSKGSKSPLLTAWSRLYLRNLIEVVGVKEAALRSAVHDERGDVSEEVALRYQRLLEDGDSFAFETLLNDTRDGLSGAIIRSLVFETLDDHGLSLGTFRWLGNAAEDAFGEPVVVGKRVRVSDPQSWTADVRAAWKEAFTEGSQPIPQLWPPREPSTQRASEHPSTGWQPGARFACDLSRLGYGHDLSVDPVPGGKRRFPPVASETQEPIPLKVATRVVRDLWRIRLFHSDLHSWSGESTEPDQLRVVGAAFSRRDPLDGSPWRDVPTRQVPSWVAEVLSSDLGHLDAGSSPVVEARAPVDEEAEEADEVGSADAESEAEDEASEDSVQPENQESSKTSKASASPAKKPARRGGMFSWLFGGEDAKEAARQRDLEKRRAAAKERRARMKARDEESKRQAVAAHLETKSRERARTHAQTARWRNVESRLERARDARLERERQHEAASRLQRRAALQTGPAGSNNLSLAAKHYLGGLKRGMLEPTAPLRAVPTPTLREVPTRHALGRQVPQEPQAPAVTAASSFIDLSSLDAGRAETADVPDAVEVSPDATPSVESDAAGDVVTPEVGPEAMPEPETNLSARRLRQRAMSTRQDSSVMAERSRRAAEARKAARERLAQQRAKLAAARAERAAVVRAAETQRDVSAASERLEALAAERAMGRDMRTQSTMLRWQHAAVLARERGLTESALRAASRARAERATLQVLPVSDDVVTTVPDPGDDLYDVPADPAEQASEDSGTQAVDLSNKAPQTAEETPDLMPPLEADVDDTGFLDLGMLLDRPTAPPDASAHVDDQLGDEPSSDADDAVVADMVSDGDDGPAIDVATEPVSQEPEEQPPGPDTDTARDAGPRMVVAPEDDIFFSFEPPAPTPTPAGSHNDLTEEAEASVEPVPPPEAPPVQDDIEGVRARAAQMQARARERAREARERAALVRERLLERGATALTSPDDDSGLLDGPKPSDHADADQPPDAPPAAAHMDVDAQAHAPEATETLTAVEVALEESPSEIAGPDTAPPLTTSLREAMTRDVWRLAEDDADDEFNGPTKVSLSDEPDIADEHTRPRDRFAGLDDDAVPHAPSDTDDWDATLPDLHGDHTQPSAGSDFSQVSYEDTDSGQDKDPSGDSSTGDAEGDDGKSWSLKGMLGLESDD